MTQTCDKCGRTYPASDTETNSDADQGLIVQTESYCPDCRQMG